MAEIDEFAMSLLEESKRFLEKARECPDAPGEVAYLHAALMLAFCSLEAHTNAIAADFALDNSLSVHEKALLLEKDVRLEDGEFKIHPSLKVMRLEDRIQFLHLRFSGQPLNRSETWWSELRSAIVLRNQLTHPKEAGEIARGNVERAVTAIIDTLNAVFLAVYRKGFPSASRGLSSRLDF
ncbi:MAG: hypothetical protein SH850_20620 [Planctomycetaceae bacterium]|nr:hypothetical protein [Planctomycetaceae bacterium]